MGEKKLQEFNFAYVEVEQTDSLIVLSLKRVMDILFSLVGLVLTFPLIFIFGVLVRMESPGPAIFTQKRVGHNGKIFKLYKIRSMRSDLDCGSKVWTQENDPRITRYGKIIRKFRIDEFPQFWNVLKGDMSLIGPRPETPYLTEEFNSEFPGFKKRLLMKPGISGWAQVNGGYEHTPDEKLFFDLEYINNYSLKLDFKVVYKTILVIFTGDGAR